MKLSKILIGIVGKKQSGKDTVAKLIHKNLLLKYNYYRIGFADALKEKVAEELGISVVHLDGIKQIPEIRQLLQRVGTDERITNPFIWIDNVEKFLVTLKEPYLCCIPDCRFLNEAEFIRKQGGVLFNIERKQLQDNDTHISETEQTKIKTDWIIQNNGTLKMLENEVINAMNYLEITNKI